MRASFIVLCLFAILPLTSKAENKINYHIGSYESAITEAANRGKLVFLDFYASWCGPCKWMDKTTFTDERVVDKLNADFISVKINIDDFDGYELKERYAISVLPTVLIFNESGQLVDRVEKTLSASALSEILERNTQHKRQIINASNASPSNLYKESMTDVSKPATRPATSKHIQIQLAVFSDYARTLKYYNQMAPIVSKPLIILHGYNGQKLIYRVMVGNLESVEEAQTLKDHLKSRYDIDSFIKS